MSKLSSEMNFTARRIEDTRLPRAATRIHRISIVTPSFNQAAFLEECIGSVQIQGYASSEHIVVDGGSTDATVDILQRHSGEDSENDLRWVSERDGGQSEALNKGFRMANGDIIGWLNSDERYRPGCFAAVIRAFDENPGVDILYGDHAWINESGRVVRVRREIEFSRFVLSYHCVNYIPTTASFFRRRIFDEGNFIDTRYHYAMDYEFFLRLAHKHYRFKHIPCLLGDFRWHAQSKSSCHTVEHLAEHDSIAMSYATTLSSFKNQTARRLALAVLRTTAAGVRYSRKFIRGYYLSQIPHRHGKL